MEVYQNDGLGRLDVQRAIDDVHLGAVLRRFILTEEYTSVDGRCLTLDGHLDITDAEEAVLLRVMAERP